MGWVLLGLGALFTAANWLIVIEWRRRRKHISLAGPLGGIGLFAGAAVLGARWGMLVALVDPGMVSLLGLPPYLLVRAIRDRRA